MTLDLHTQLEHCTYCPKMCRHACPVSNADGHEVHIPQAKMATLNQIRLGHERWTPETSSPIWACTGCGHCTTYCAHGVTPGTSLFTGREEAVRRGVIPPALAMYPERFRAREERLAGVLRDLAGPRQKPRARIALWPGCDAVDKGAGDVRASLALLDRVLDEPVGVVDGPRVCGGYPLLAAGHADEFRWHALRVAAELSRYGQVIMNCSACVHALRALYPAEGVHLAAEILHVSEVLAPHAPKLAPTVAEPANDGPIYYHDPCYLARHERVMDAPRTVLGKVAEVRELAWSRGDTECCGGGGMLPKTMPDVADAMARRRLAEVADAGGGTVVTSCGTCKYMLARNAPEGVTVRDLAEVVEERTRPSRPPATTPDR